MDVDSTVIGRRGSVGIRCGGRVFWEAAEKIVGSIA
jgi:hypothetical protein